MIFGMQMDIFKKKAGGGIQPFEKEEKASSAKHPKG